MWYLHIDGGRLTVANAIVYRWPHLLGVAQISLHAMVGKQMIQRHAWLILGLIRQVDLWPFRCDKLSSSAISHGALSRRRFIVCPETYNHKRSFHVLHLLCLYIGMCRSIPDWPIVWEDKLNSIFKDGNNSICITLMFMDQPFSFNRDT